ncbi:MAG: ATP-binding protein [Phycisphaerae bacterium]|nr:ATP-binding protein [Phycisphaerae bacterium]
MARKRVKVGRDHVQRLIGTSPQKAIEELIWNALDAGGDRVEVKLRLNKMGGVDCVQVIDRGPGIPSTDLDRAFGNIGNSIKAQRHANADGRAYHGREGKGRFKALALSPTAIWETVFRENGVIKSYRITLRRDDPDYFDSTDPTESKAKSTGTRVILDGLDKGHQSLSRDDVRDKLAEEFAAYLTSYPGVSLVWDGRPIRIDDVIDRREELDVLTIGDRGGPASMLVIEWKFRPDGKRLHICDENGFSFHEMPAGVQAPGIEYTAYLRTRQTREWNESARFVVQELDEEIARVVNVAKERLREYVRARMAEEAVSVVQEWKDQEIYPYGTDEPTGPLAKAEREVFDIVAVRVNEQHSTFEQSDPQNKRLTLALIKQALESNPSNLTKILREVLSLPEEEQNALAELLDRAPLANLIRAGRLVADRLDTLHAFEHILFDTDWKKRLLERTQLHRLLVHEIWMLGEEYMVGGDDDGLRDVLNKHLDILGREELAPDVDVKLIDGKDGIPDLMLYRRRKVDRDRFEHLVVELKRPRDHLGQVETSQIKKYAFTVAKDERFNTSKCSWEFVLLGNDLDDFVVQETSSAKLPEGCLFEGDGVRIWVRRWADVLNDARARYEFFREQLNVEASHTKGLDALKARYPHLFEGRGARKGRDLALSASKST